MSGEQSQTHTRKIPAVSWVLIALALTGLLFGGVTAYLSTSTGAVSNTFQPDVDNTPTVSGYAVNVGTPGYSVYVRAAVVVNWVDDSSNEVLAVQPVAGTDYDVTYNKDDWFEKDGFWYYEKPLISGETTALIKTYDEVTTRTGYTLKVDILAQTIQALGTTDIGETPAVTDAWGVYVDSNGELTSTPPTT